MRRVHVPNPWGTEPESETPEEGTRPARPPVSVGDIWSSETPLLQLGPEDWFTIGHSFEGVLAMGQTGSGKSSGPGANFARSFLRAGFGGLVTCTKPGEADEWRRLAQQTGRERDFRVVTPGGPWALNALDYQYRAGVRGGGLSDNVVALVMEWMSAKDRSRGQPSDPFWIDSARLLLTSAIDLLGISGETISFPAIARAIESAADTAEEVRSSEWQANSFLNGLVNKAVGRRDLTPAQETDLGTAVTYWLHAYPRLDPKTRSGIVATVKSLVYPFERSLLSGLFGGRSTCPPEDCYRTGAVVVLDLPVKEFLEAGTAAQILYLSIWMRAIERRDVARHPRPVFLFIDEYQNFITPYQPLFQATARSSRCATVVMTQSLTSIASRFAGSTGRAETETLLANFNLKAYCAQDDVETNSWASKMIGERWVTSQNVSASLGGQGHMTAGTTEQRRYLVEPLEFVKLRKGGPDAAGRVEVILFRSGRQFASGHNHTRVTFNQNLGK